MSIQETRKQFDTEWKTLVDYLANLKNSREFKTNWERFMVGVSKLKNEVQPVKPSQENDKINQAFRSRFFS